MEEKTFKLEELDNDFWDKVILINIWPSSGLSGYGSMWLVTSEKKEYFIDFEAFPFSERDLEKFTPLLKRKERIVDYAHPYAIEDNGWTYLSKERTLIRNDFYEPFMKAYSFHTKSLSERGLATRHMPTIAGYAMGLSGELERFDEEKAYLLWQNRQSEAKKREKLEKSIALTEEDFVWKKLYTNNNPENSLEWGEYAFIFKEVEERIVGYKFTILYQREEIVPLIYSGKNGRVECYNLLEQKYDDIQGPLLLGEDTKDSKYPLAFDTSNTLNDYSVNTFGEFIRSFKTIEEAKSYILEVVNIRHYANKWNIIKDLSCKSGTYKNWLRKYEGILAFRRYYKEILDIVCNYQHCVIGGRDIMDEIKRKLNIEESLLREIRQYIPMILSVKTQEKAADIVSECREYLDNGVTV